MDQIDNFHRNILRDPNWGPGANKLASTAPRAQGGNQADKRNMAGLPPAPIINKMADKQYLITMKAT